MGLSGENICHLSGRRKHIEVMSIPQNSVNRLLHILSLCLDGGGEEAELGASSHRLLRVRGLVPGVRLTSQHSIGYNFHV
jgi:hypothetical protein